MMHYYCFSVGKHVESSNNAEWLNDGEWMQIMMMTVDDDRGCNHHSPSFTAIIQWMRKINNEGGEWWWLIDNEWAMYADRLMTN